jgi:hypothetical protein
MCTVDSSLMFSLVDSLVVIRLSYTRCLDRIIGINPFVSLP